jgi:hypothetical protein
VPGVYTPADIERARELIEADVASGGWESAPHHDDGVTHWKPYFEAAMTVLYLQPNHPEFGGGITVVPETHKEPDFYHRIPKMRMVERGILKAQKIAGISHFDKLDKHKTSIRSKAKLATCWCWTCA